MADFRTLLGGLGMGECGSLARGPAGLRRLGSGRDRRRRCSSGTRETVTTVDANGMPFCLDWLPDGRLVVITQHGLNGCRAQTVPLTAYADLSGLSEYAWNDIAVDGRGNVFVNNINFDFGGEFAPGIVVLVRPDGAVQQVADGIAFPNGMAVTAGRRRC